MSEQSKGTILGEEIRSKANKLSHSEREHLREIAFNEFMKTPRTDAEAQKYDWAGIPLDFARNQEKQINVLEEALIKIQECNGAYNRDPLEHATNVINNSVALATEALREAERLRSLYE